MAAASRTNPSKCFFVDDSLLNIRAAKRLGWGSCVYFREITEGETLETAEELGVDAVISDLEQLRTVWPRVFKNVALTLPNVDHNIPEIETAE